VRPIALNFFLQLAGRYDNIVNVDFTIFSGLLSCMDPLRNLNPGLLGLILVETPYFGMAFILGLSNIDLVLSSQFYPLKPYVP
jgi:hypothetical protein